MASLRDNHNTVSHGNLCVGERSIGNFQNISWLYKILDPEVII